MTTSGHPVDKPMTRPKTTVETSLMSVRVWSGQETAPTRPARYRQGRLPVFTVASANAKPGFLASMVAINVETSSSQSIRFN